MKILNQLLTQREIDLFRKYYSDHNDHKYVNYQIGDQIIDHRLRIDETSPEFEIIRRIVHQIFPAPKEFWSAFQRQSSPHLVHIDDYKSEMSFYRYTYVIALDTVPEFKTMVWKEKAWNNQALTEYVARWGKLKPLIKKVSNISEVEDLEHTFDVNQNDYMVDYMNLDGIFSYVAGDGCLFDATQMHCTSNWRKYNRWPHRELLQIHVVNETELDI